ncbi:MAG: 50S ribosomal protein L25, partial [Chloroflexi bacterium]|nr:50S ribosomal protein L25 [Chloroflexota bacterium]
AFAREIQWDPRRDDLIHVDFLVAEATRLVSARVPVVISGDSEGARSSGGRVVQQLREVDVEALPLEMPSELEADAVLLAEPDSVIRVSDLKVPSNVTVLNDSEEVVARVDIPRVAVEEEVEEVAAEGDDAPEEGSAG